MQTVLLLFLNNQVFLAFYHRSIDSINKWAWPQWRQALRVFLIIVHILRALWQTFICFVKGPLPASLLFYFRLFNNKQSICWLENFADDWIRTANLWIGSDQCHFINAKFSQIKNLRRAGKAFWILSKVGNK